MPEASIGTWVIVLGLVVLIVIGLVLLIIKWLVKEDIDEKSKTITEIKTENKNEDFDIDNILNDIEK